MKTMKAGAVVLLGLVLAAPAWGQKFERVPGGDPREFRMSGPITGGVCALKTSQNCSYFIYEDGPHYIGEGSGGSVAIFHHNSPDDGEKVRS